MIDWTSVTNFQQAARNVRGDTYGDWYRDPWGWPEIEWVTSAAQHFFISRVNDRGAKRAIPLEVPKENFVLRPALLLDPLDRLVYQGLVDSLSSALIGDMPDFVFGWRLPTKQPKKGFYSKNSAQWQGFRDRLQKLGEQHEYGLTTDIVSFFHSIQIDRLYENILQIAKRNAVIDRVFDLLNSWDAVPSRGGLPQRCLASSILAQFVLRPVDDLLSLQKSGKRTRRGSKTLACCRWMDDIWIFSNNRSGLRMAQLDLQGCLWGLNLNLNAGKTDLREGEELRRAIREYEHSAADFGLKNENTGPLEELVEGILGEPETAPRTTIRFVTSRLRSHGLAFQIDRFVDKAMQMPHGSDHLARLFRDLEIWRDLEEWYVEHVISCSGLEWTTYQLGTMFPSHDRSSDAILNCFAERLASGQIPLLMVPLVVQRLAAWRPKEARAIIQSLATANTYSDPFALRAFAFAGISAGVPPVIIRALLRQFPENELQMAFLESRDFKAIPVVSDFAADSD